MSDGPQSLHASPQNKQSTRKSSWKQVYLTLHHEKDVKRLTQAVMAAETAIYERLQELSGQSDHSEERDEIRSAIQELLKIRTQKLGWPNPSS